MRATAGLVVAGTWEIPDERVNTGVAGELGPSHDVLLTRGPHKLCSPTSFCIAHLIFGTIGVCAHICSMLWGEQWSGN